jgi:hypothetical protein
MPVAEVTGCRGAWYGPPPDIGWLCSVGYPPMWLISTLVTPVVSDVRLSE